MESNIENNSVVIGGTIESAPEFSHEIYDEKFYKFEIKSKRLSNYEDILPVIISERIIDLSLLKVGKIVKITGQYRSHNMQNGQKNKLVLSIFVKEIELTDDESVLTTNNIDLIGYICKEPVYRKTPLGREIADVLIAVNRTYKKSDYIPCILWGRNAKYCESLNIGDEVKLSGRIQARQYEKRIDENNTIKKVAYEVSVAKFNKIDEEDNSNE